VNVTRRGFLLGAGAAAALSASGFTLGADAEWAEIQAPDARLRWVATHIHFAGTGPFFITLRGERLFACNAFPFHVGDIFLVDSPLVLDDLEQLAIEPVRAENWCAATLLLTGVDHGFSSLAAVVEGLSRRSRLLALSWPGATS